MCVTADGGNALNSEIEGFYGESGFLEEGHDETTQTAVDVKPDVILLRQCTETDNVILASVWEVDR